MVKAITHILVNDNTVKSAVGKNKADDKWKVYPVVCPSTEEQKYITVQQASKTPIDCKQGRATSFEGTFDVLCWAKNYDDLDGMVEAVIDALDQKASGTYNGVELDEIRYVNAIDRFDNAGQLYVRIVSFRCWVNEN